MTQKTCFQARSILLLFKKCYTLVICKPWSHFLYYEKNGLQILKKANQIWTSLFAICHIWKVSYSLNITSIWLFYEWLKFHVPFLCLMSSFRKKWQLSQHSFSLAKRIKVLECSDSFLDVESNCFMIQQIQPLWNFLT